MTDLYLAENDKTRQEKAAGTTQFLGEQAQKLYSDVQGLEKRLLDLRSKYNGSLPEQFAMNTQLLNQAQAQLMQLLDNLMSNAIRYACHGTACAIQVSATAEDGFVRVSVRDNGPGIPREHLRRVTERFYRVDAARSRESGGTGLGLAIVKHVVERHRGTLEIRSIVGEGTEVVVRLPAAA